MNVWALQVPSWWPVLLLLPVLLWIAHVRAQRYCQQLQAELGRRETQLLGRRSFVVVRRALVGLAVTLMTLALLRPVQPGREAQIFPDVVLCVDVSRSIAAADGAPTRFAALQQQLHQLLDHAIGSRFALLAFAGSVQPVAPLTADRQAVGWLLDELVPGVLPSDAAGAGTNLGAAIEAATESLSRVASTGDLLLLTDGEDFAGTAQRAAEVARATGQLVYCIGYGSTAGSKIVVVADGEQSFLQDGAGNDVVTHLDVASLASVAAAGGGTFTHEVAANAVLDLWRDELVPASAQRRLEARDTDVVQRFAFPLCVGIWLLMLAMCLPERLR